MKILEDTPLRLSIQNRRSLEADLILVSFILVSIIPILHLVRGDTDSHMITMAVFGLVFGAVGVAGLVLNGTTTATLDAKRNTLEIAHRAVFGTQTQVFALNDLLDVSVYERSSDEGDRTHTLHFHLKSGETVRFDKVYGNNPAVYGVADRAHAWLAATQAARVEAT